MLIIIDIEASGGSVSGEGEHIPVVEVVIEGEASGIEDADVVADQLEQSGLVVRARLLREPVDPEKLRQAYLLAGKPADA